ncbi:MAG: NAD-dependent epimerase/dehydratase family protein [Anaerolineae bacterium]|nr:NAD-dependent epimerase/dehydratase family protein [Anaerolineae bacterium]MBN8621460.1 NAD-dependent epimerase/dehydratase family protein [Anaerolineae bacterium]
MAIVIVTGSAGLIGSETVKRFHAEGYDVLGIDNDMRAYFFGSEASTSWNRERLIRDLPRYQHFNFDIRNFDQIEPLFKRYGADVALIVHTAAQPSHDWAAREPFTDFTINANGTLNLLEAARRHCPQAVFIFTSTNKVYGDTPNTLPLVEQPERWEVDPAHPYAAHGIDEHMTLDQSKHSLFGASKVAADVLVQEYGRYFGLRTGIFRGGCLTGPAHSGAELHGFLAFLTLRAVRGQSYTIYGYKGKQVRDNIHSRDLVNAFWHFFQNPRVSEVYNIGGSRHSNVSMLEAIRLIREIGGYDLHYTLTDQARSGDHIWYVSDVRKFQQHYPDWRYQYTIEEILRELIDHIAVREDVH